MLFLNLSGRSQVRILFPAIIFRDFAYYCYNIFLSIFSKKENLKVKLSRSYSGVNHNSGSKRYGTPFFRIRRDQCHVEFIGEKCLTKERTKAPFYTEPGIYQDGARAVAVMSHNSE